MGIIKRCARLFEADLHGILDCLEDPQTLLVHSLREMESLLEEESVEIQEREHTLEYLDAREKKLMVERAEAQENVTLCLTHHDEMLAKVALRKRIELDTCISCRDSSHELS